MKVVLTGATGLIGQALNARLQQEGHEVIVLKRPEWNGERDVPRSTVFDGCEALVHLAGENVAGKRWTRTRKAHLIDSRVKSAENLRLGLERAGVRLKTFISASAVGIYGDRGDEILTEKSRSAHDFLSDLCQAWEDAADQIPADRILKARFGLVLSSNGGFLERVVPMFKRFGAGPLSDGCHWMPWVHIDDAVEVLVRALEDSRMVGPINIVAPHPVTNAEFTEELRLALDTFRAPAAPKLLLKLMFGELSEALLASERVIPEKLEHLGYRWKFATLKEALTNTIPGSTS